MTRQEAGNWWERAFDAIGDMVLLVDDKLRVLRANRAVSTRLGKPWEEIGGRSCGEIFGDEPQFIKRALIEKQATTADLECAIPGAWEWTACPVETEDHVEGAVVYARDAKKLRHAEERVRKLGSETTRLLRRATRRGEAERDRLASALDAVPDCVLIVDDDYTIQLANKAAHEALRDAAGRECYARFAGRARPCDICPIEAILHEGKNGFSHSARIGDKDYEWHAARFLDPGGANAVIVVISDVTENRRLEEKSVQSEKLSALGEFISGVAHELNNPLAAVIGFSQLLQAETSPDRIRGGLRNIRQSAERCHRIVRNLLSFARKHKPERRQVDLAEILHGVCDILAYEARMRGIEINEDLDPELPRIEGDSHMLQQALLNILLNAFQAISSSQDSGVITVRALPANGGVQIGIGDTGPGIRPEVLPRIFEPFFTTKPEAHGTGLGLSMARDTVKDHGGSVRAESEFGKGTRFVIELPSCGRAAAPERTSRGRRAPRPEKALHVLSGEERP